MQSGHVQLHSCLFQLGAVHAACPPALCQRSATVSAQQVWSGRRARRPRYTIAAKRSLTTARGSVPRLGLISTQEFRRNVGICLVNKEGLVFAARCVQGGIDPCENPFTAAARELLEETGIRSIEFLAQIDQWIDYEFPTTVQSSLTGCWTRYKGQTQKWMLFKFYGEDSEIDLDVADKEFLEYKWTDLHDLPDGVVQFKQHVYQHVMLEFGPHIEKIKKSGTP